MLEMTTRLQQLTQHATLQIFTHCFRADEPPRPKLRTPHRHPYYLLLYLTQGRSRQVVDLAGHEVTAGEVFFMTPHQVHVPADDRPHPSGYLLALDEACLAQLPQAYAFLINPLHQPVFALEPAARTRLAFLFDALRAALDEARHHPPATALVLAYLHALLSELNLAYFQAHPRFPMDGNLQRFIQFKQLVEAQCTAQFTVAAAARALGVSGSVLASLVKRYSGISPKVYLQRRLVLEAQRRLLHGAHVTTKEIAYQLGFNDPNYFSRLFRQQTGGSVTEFRDNAQNLSSTFPNLSSMSKE